MNPSNYTLSDRVDRYYATLVCRYCLRSIVKSDDTTEKNGEVAHTTCHAKHSAYIDINDEIIKLIKNQPSEL